MVNILKFVDENVIKQSPIKLSYIGVFFKELYCKENQIIIVEDIVFSQVFLVLCIYLVAVFFPTIFWFEFIAGDSLCFKVLNEFYDCISTVLAGLELHSGKDFFRFFNCEIFVEVKPFCITTQHSVANFVESAEP